MNVQRFFISPQFINTHTGTVICQDAKLVKQVRKVLRLENGDQIDVLDGQGHIYHCTLQNILPNAERDIFQAKIESEEKIISEIKTKFIVGLPLIKASRFEWALEKLTELGANTISPIILHRSITKESGDYKNKLSRWGKIVQEAAEQSERISPPELTAPINFSEWLDEMSQEESSSLNIICAERLNVEPLEKVLYNRTTVPRSCAIALGAEGGFTEDEMSIAQSHKFIPVSLGPLILRSETAAIYALAIARALLNLK